MQTKDDRKNYGVILDERTGSYLVHLGWTKTVYVTYIWIRFSLAWRMPRRWANRHFTLVCPLFYTPVLPLKGSKADQGGLSPRHWLSGSGWIFCEICVLSKKVVKERKEPSFSQLSLGLPPGSVAAGRCQHLSRSLHRKLGSKILLELCENGKPCSHSGSLQQCSPRPAEHWLCYHSHR